MSFASLPSVPAAAVPDGAPLLDVRESDEWAAGHAEDAVHVPMSQVLERFDEIAALGESAGDGEVYVVCKVGGRSAQVAQYLLQRGVNAVNVDGGMHAWQAAGRPLTGDGDEPYVL
ncbi:rhodanese-like domain-containing protein [Streptomyces sp. NPDC049881]|uniref:rhodanese-like domain-containing protein n=1 Tax=unclassified Streptomyces TaxID=2593676 RepID=UPI003429F033